MNTLHTFGCSLTASTDWPDMLARKMKLSLSNHAVPAGDNITQVRRFKDHVLKNEINEHDLVIWEVTYLNRLGFRLSQDHHFYTANRYNEKVNHNFHLTTKNIVDEKQHIDYVAFNKDWYDVNWYVQNIGEMLSDLLFAIKTANEMTKGCLVWFADNNIFEDRLTKENFINFLQQNQINTVGYESAIMSWTRDNNFAMAPDGMHPASDVYRRYAETILEPRLIQL